MKRTDLTAVVCVFLPLVMGAPVDDALKQQIASGLLRGEDTPYWAANTLNQGRSYGGIPLRRLEANAGYHMGNLQKRFDSLSGATFGTQKRNFDEIDRNGFGSFLNKRNFDEIDRNGFNGFNKRNFDEIDRTGFGSFVKRAV